MICRLGQSEVEDELQQEEKITIWMDENNYPFFQKISKGGKVTVNLLGDQFSLAFTMPNEARTKLAKGLKLLEKIGGLSNAALTFSLFNGTAMTTN